MVRGLLGRFFFGIFINVCTPIFSVLAFWICGWYLRYGLEARLALVNIGLVISVIVLLFYNRFVPKVQRVIKNPEGYHYLVEGRTHLHIPDPETFNYLGAYLGFSWVDAEIFTSADIKRKFFPGRELPSIHLYSRKVEQSNS